MRSSTAFRLVAVRHRLNGRTGILFLAVATWLNTATPAPAAGVELVNAQTPWRTYLTVGPKLEMQGSSVVFTSRGKLIAFDPATNNAEVCGFSRMPAGDWTGPDCDVSAWARYLPSDLADYLGRYGAQVPGPWPALLCLRTGFGISDPERAVGLKVSVTFLGGAVAYVNGHEVGRRFLPAGPIFPLTPAEPYPMDAYICAGSNAPLPILLDQARGPGTAVKHDTNDLPHYEQRIRPMSFEVPKEVLVKGTNILCLEIHQAPIAGPLQRIGWAHVGFVSVTLTAASATGVVVYSDATKGTRIWSANPEDQIADAPSAKSLIDAPGTARRVRGIHAGNPFDPLLPVRMAAPRNGVASGQAVLTDPAGLRNVEAAMSALRGPHGEIPTNAVEIRYAVQCPGFHYCDALLPAPTNGARTVPIWIMVKTSKEQVPGWYTGTLSVRANGRTFAAPVHVLVTGVTVPDPGNFVSRIGIANAPDTVAAYYKVEPWSADHFRLMEPSLRLMGLLGNNVLRVPVILGGMQPTAHDRIKPSGVLCQPLVRWVRIGDRLAPDFRLLDAYLDVYLKYCAPPEALSLYVWEAACSQEVADAYATRRIPVREVQPKAPLLVQFWDPATGMVSNITAPRFSDPDAEAFWKPFFEGIRNLVVKRGWPERIIMASMGGDMRPSQREAELLRQWAPYVRWNILSHFSGDPGPKDGKLIATGGLEVGLKEHPWRVNRRAYTAAELEFQCTNRLEYLDLPTARWHWNDESPPFVFRALPTLWGALGHLGLDFWRTVPNAPGNVSYFTASSALTVPGTNGAEPTVRFQMLREGIQEAELRWMIAQGYLRMPENMRKPYRELLNETSRRLAASWFAGQLSQCELGYDWRTYSAALQTAAAELTGGEVAATWAEPPR